MRSLPRSTVLPTVDRRLDPAVESGGRGRRRPCPVHPPPPRVRRLSEGPAGAASRAARAARDDRPRSGGTSPPPGAVRRGSGRRRRRRARGGRPAGRSRVERRNPRPSSGRWPAAPRRRTAARTWCGGSTRRAWLITSAVTPRWRGASWSKRWTSRWPGRLGAACCWTSGWPSPRPKGGGGPGPCSRRLGARRGTIARCGPRIEQNLGYTWLFRGDLAASERHARAALQLAEELQDPRVMAEAFQAYPFVEFVLGRGVDQELLDRGIALEGHMEGEFKSHVLRASFIEAQLLKFTDRLDEARRTFTELLADAAAHGVESPIPQFRYHLAELECWAGNWDAAMEHARASRAAAQRHRWGAPLSSEGHFAVGLVQAHLGRVEPARLAALEGLRVAEEAGEVLIQIMNLAVLGFLELSLDRARRGRCVPVHGRRARAGDGSPGARLLPRRPGRGRGARRPRAARRGRVAPRPLRGGRQGPRPGLGHRHRREVPGARARRRGEISTRRRPPPTRQCGNTIVCPFRSSWGEHSWCAERWSVGRRGSARPETR